MATLENIQAKIARLQSKADALRKWSLAAIAKIQELMERHGVTLADLELRIGGARGGRRPTQVGGGEQPGTAKYVDPKSGATWTGQGRTPAWIASAKDRGRFLVCGSVQYPGTKRERQASGQLYSRSAVAKISRSENGCYLERTWPCACMACEREGP
ncbi:MAG: H-NS histone family protein [Paraburkholderia sp.]|nr:MAG: H-NS histone family protein [Paraburkholderia sp.]